MIDEPGSTLPGASPNQFLCPTPATGCAEYVSANTAQGFGYAVNTVAGTASGVPTGYNVFQGVVGPGTNAVTFNGIPLLPPTTSGSRVFRITNVRVNANQVGGGSASGGQQVIASISLSPASAAQFNIANQPVGLVTPGLTTKVTSIGSPFQQCSSQTKSSIATLSFTENFNTAFKTRVSALLPSENFPYAGQGTAPYQNVPNTVYNSESNFIFPVGSAVAGLADYGTRLKAVFTGIPAGATLFVSVNNVSNAVMDITPPAGFVAGSSVYNLTATQQTYAQLVSVGSTDTVSDGTGASIGYFPAITGTDTSPFGTKLQLVAVPTANGSGSAEWEMVNTNPNATETVNFGVYITYVANTATNVPAPGTSTVNLSFGPLATSGVASSSATIPRFADTSTAKTLLSVGICRTVLLYPYVLNQIGLDTGLSIANTTSDGPTFATGAQAGTCTLNWYGGTTPPAATVTPSVAAGQLWTGTVSTYAPGFQGYMIAICNFQFAHGFAFISDIGIRNVAMGYLAVVLNDPGNGNARTPAATGVPASPGPEVGGN
jgi:hypothetical protein